MVSYCLIYHVGGQFSAQPFSADLLSTAILSRSSQLSCCCGQGLVVSYCLLLWSGLVASYCLIICCGQGLVASYCLIIYCGQGLVVNYCVIICCGQGLVVSYCLIMLVVNSQHSHSQQIFSAQPFSADLLSYHVAVVRGWWSAIG